MDDGGRIPIPTTLTAVAVDSDKNSKQAVKWAMDHLLLNNHTAILLHVRSHPPINHGFAMTEATAGATKEQLESEGAHLFMPYRAFCARRGIHMKEVILDDNDISKAIIDYITAKHIHNIVVGASSRNPLTKKFRNTDVATNILRAAPEFCAVYVVSKGRPVHVRSAKAPAAPPRQPLAYSTHPPDPDGCIRAASFPRENRNRARMANSLDLSHHPLRPSATARDLDANRDSIDFQGGLVFQSAEFGGSFKLPPTGTGSPGESSSPIAAGSKQDLGSEMKRLKLELKRTMDMYSTACKEAITAKQKAKELHQWKVEGERKAEEAKQAEEAALALAEMEKAKCRAALEAAAAAQMIAEIEAKKRKKAEMKAKREEKEKVRALDALTLTDFRYRKYSLEDIQIATEYFSESLKIGEGGYGPVYRASLDHTPVAIKVLRPGAKQGRQQFQQEVEVLCCIRHPNMVLLLGACPEYGCLVYEYMDNGSLEDRLFQQGDTPPIPWSVRFKIAAEIATGLLFLHQAKPEPLVHRDLKPGNILLDRNYVSKISDVGLSRLVPPAVADAVTQYRMTAAAGTFCYIDPEYQQTGMLGIKSDIYSLGVLLLQIVTAMPPMGLTHHVERAIQKGAFADMLDPTVQDWPVEEALGFAKLALKCSELRRKDRPDLGMVVLPELNRLRNLGHAYEAGYSVDSGSSSFSSESIGFSSEPQQAESVAGPPGLE